MHAWPSNLDASFATLDLITLASVSGGQAKPAEAPQSRTWGQVARDYAATCVVGAGQAALSSRPRSVREAAVNAAFGCGMNVAKMAVDDVNGALTAGR